MFDLEQYLSTVFQNSEIKTVLDLGTGTGRYSIFAASYGANIVAVDNRKMKGYGFPTFLEHHPKITFFEDDILHFLDGHNGTYDLILLFNVIVFLKKTEFLLILPKLLGILTPGGTLAISFFFADDETMSQNQELSFYDFDDFIPPEGYALIRKENELIEEAHKPYGLHTHHIGYIEIKYTQ